VREIHIIWWYWCVISIQEKLTARLAMLEPSDLLMHAPQGNLPTYITVEQADNMHRSERGRREREHALNKLIVL
jgi:hypothetical protein